MAATFGALRKLTDLVMHQVFEKETLICIEVDDFTSKIDHFDALGRLNV